jgi:hypothetical protein
MYSEVEEKIEEQQVLKRVPPGDRWETTDGKKLFPNLTAGLDFIFGQNGITDFKIYARKGIVCTGLKTFYRKW